MERSRLSRWVTQVTPPALLPGVKRVARLGRPGPPPEWEYVPEGWRRAQDDARGWNAPEVVRAYRAKVDAVRAAVAGTGPLAFGTSRTAMVGRPDVAEQNTLLAFAVALLLTSQGRRAVSVLDWGGGFGFHALVARTVLPDDVELEYHCRELPKVCEAARPLVPEVTFWDGDECFARRYDLVLASSALQYVEAWSTTLRQLVDATSDGVFLTRVPSVIAHPSFVVLQRTEGEQSDGEYLSWVFNREELLGAVADAGAELVREFVLGHRPFVVGAPEQDETRAWYFRRPDPPSARAR